MLTIEQIREILSQGTSNEIKDELLTGSDDDCALYLLAQNNEIELIRDMLRKDDVGNYLYPGAIHKAVRFGSYPTMAINKALACAARLGHIDIARMLLEKDGDGNYIHPGVNVAAAENDALRGAAHNGYTDIVRMLLEKDGDGHYIHQGVNVAAFNNYALRYAARNNHLGVIKILLEKNTSGGYVHGGTTDDVVANVLSTSEGHPMTAFMMASILWPERKVPRSVRNKDMILSRVESGASEALDIMRTYYDLACKLLPEPLARDVCNYLYGMGIANTVLGSDGGAFVRAREKRGRLEAASAGAGAGEEGGTSREIIFSTGPKGGEVEMEDIVYADKRTLEEEPSSASPCKKPRC